MAEEGGRAYTNSMPKQRGFTLTELLIAVAIIALLAGLLTVYMFRHRSTARLARVSTELGEIATALSQYAEDNSYQYPVDTARGIPPGVEKYLSAGTWPVSIWPEGVFDYDNILHPGPGANAGKQIFQIAYRLCDTDDAIATCSDSVLFPNFTRYSAILYCISGPCIPHSEHPTDPAYCVNCKPKEQNY